MARRKKLKALLVSSPKGLNKLQPLINKVLLNHNTSIQLDLYGHSNSGALILNTRQREKNFIEVLTSSELIIVDLHNISPSTFFDIGIARALGKTLVFLSEEGYLDDLPNNIFQIVTIIYNNQKELESRLNSFVSEYIESPKRFAPRNIIDTDTSSQIIVDVERLNARDFENLCFELLSRLGYKDLEWKVKGDFIDAATTLRKQDPDGYEYNEFWLISFGDEHKLHELLDIAYHDPEYFVERIYRNFEYGMGEGSKIRAENNDAPLTLLIISRQKERFSKKLIRNFTNQEFRMKRPGSRFTIRVRWWDEQIITSLVQNNLPLARKYFSSDALQRSGVRLSYEELYKEYAELNDQLQKANQQLISERNKIQLLERDAAWKLLSFTAAHRLGNPMDAIDSELSNLKQVLKLGKSEMVDEIIKSMEFSIERAKSIVSEFRNLSVAHELNPEVVNSDKLHEILNYSAKQAINKSIKVIFKLDKVPEILIDIKKVSDCFSELISNSIHHLTSGTHQKITITLEAAVRKELPEDVDGNKEYVKIVFSDNGCGVPNEKKEIIFKPFERSYVHGTGLGLAFCQNIFDGHGGKIREVGRAGEGAIFEIFLPVKK